MLLAPSPVLSLSSITWSLEKPFFGETVSTMSVSYDGDESGRCCNNRNVKQVQPAGSEEEETIIRRFAAVYAELRDELLHELEELGISAALTGELKSYYRRLFDHSVDGGKMTRGITVVKAYQACQACNARDGCKKNGREHSEDSTKAREMLQSMNSLEEGKELRQAAILGWCVEWLQALFLTADDVMDHSHTRRGAPCWYRLEGVTATNAINDSLFLSCCIYRILRRHLSERKHYARLMELLHDITYATVIGQHLDTNAQPIGKSDVVLSRVTEERYKAIVKYKTAYYSFYLPCALGMTLGGVSDPQMFYKTKNICFAIGEYFQIQDDVLDCFAPSKVLGKVGTDIEEKKCSWLLLQIMEAATKEELEELTKNYGVDEPEKVQWVKALYSKYKMHEKFRSYEEEAVSKIREMIREVEHEGLRSLFSFLLDKLYKREK